MTAEVHIILGRASNVLTIPSAALGARDAQERYTVRVVEADGRLAERKVEIGLNDKVMAEVRSGLTEGDRIVTGEMTAPASQATRGTGGPPPPMGL